MAVYESEVKVLLTLNNKDLAVKMVLFNSYAHFHLHTPTCLQGWDNEFGHLRKVTT